MFPHFGYNALGIVKVRVASYESSVVSCQLRVGSCKVRVGSCELQVDNCELQVDNCELLKLKEKTKIKHGKGLF